MNELQHYIYPILFPLQKLSVDGKLPLIIPFANKKQTKNKKNRAPVWDFAKLSCSNYEDHKKDDDGKKNIIPLF